jgi:hypothetical protein
LAVQFNIINRLVINSDDRMHGALILFWPLPKKFFSVLKTQGTDQAQLIAPVNGQSARSYGGIGGLSECLQTVSIHYLIKDRTN